MQQSIKRKIAKEIIIFFSSILVIGLTWTIFWTVNKVNISKTESLQDEIKTLNHAIDSIKLSFPKAKTFQEIFLGNVPGEFYEKTGDFDDFGVPIIRSLKQSAELPSLAELNEENKFKKTRTINFRKLFNILDKSRYPFAVSSFSKYDMPIFQDFEKALIKELEGDTLNLDSISLTKPKLKKIFDFLKENKYLTVNFDEFVLTIEELPLPPPHSTWTIYQSDKIKKEELKPQLNRIHSNIYSASQLANIAIWISIIVLSIVYPIRALTFLLIWAFKTIRQ